MLASRYSALLLLFSLFSLLGQARVLEVKIESRTPVLNGKSWGSSGAYELIKGTITYGLDPDHVANQKIIDLYLAPRNADGLVVATGHLVVAQPLDRSKGSGLAMVEVSNRGGKFTPSYFNQATKGRELLPDDPAYWGDGLLLEQGMTLIWVGWQFDVPVDENTLRLEVPKVTQQDGSPIMGWVRSDWTVDQEADFLSLGHRMQTGYPAIDLDSKAHQLTVRDGRDAPRSIVPRATWSFGRIEDGKVVRDAKYIHLEGGFKAGKIYELVYKSKDPVVVGMGLTAIRDVLSYAKYDASCPFSVKQGIATGVSQTGRFLRTFLYHGLNTDEAGRQVYDGMLIITAGAGRGSFNHRFGQPSRDAHRYSAFFYPTDVFPFTGIEQEDPFTGNKDGLYNGMRVQEHLPKIFYVNTGYEYWGRAASMIHMRADGQSDAPLAEHERVYHIASGQHFVDAFPPRPERKLGQQIAAYRGNPLQFKPNYRALLLHLGDWVSKDKNPPASQYPKIEQGELVSKESLDFPYLKGLAAPKVIHHAYQVDYGERWKLDGIVDHQPPILGYAYPSLVPQVDRSGNEMGGIRNVEIRVPLATYTPWSLRGGMAGDTRELADFRGMYIPFARTEQERIVHNDPRPSINSLYPNKETYEAKVQEAITDLVQEGFLLERDREFVQQQALKHWEYTDTGLLEELETRGPQKGKCLVIGGGRLDWEIYESFRDLAGGDSAKIVIIPSASEDRYILRDGYNKRLKIPFEKVGLNNITVLHTRDRKVADSDSFIAPLQEADGVWFVGGRQWRLVDAYGGTKTEIELQKVLERDGVIAGTSAGATIQGSYLARGDSKTNQIMMGDHEEGFSYITNVAIDQHLLARNRQFDLFEVLEKYPHLLGIGLDEGTAIVVEKDMAQVIGRSYVVFYDPSIGEQSFLMLKKGQKYDLRTRQKVD
ncbi:MAG: cyanophycinase [Saprospiraceae bacterium]|nr:cyanophycinase [Saprospiraceae bacterium]